MSLLDNDTVVGIDQPTDDNDTVVGIDQADHDRRLEAFLRAAKAENLTHKWYQIWNEQNGNWFAWVQGVAQFDRFGRMRERLDFNAWVNGRALNEKLPINLA